VPAAGLADVIVRDAHPAVALGGGDHRLDQGPVGMLGVVPAPELALGVAKPQRERVADPLELAGPEHARPPGRTDPPFEALAGEGLAEEGAEPALDPGDLAAQVLARPPLGRLADPRLRERGARRPGGGLCHVECARHEAPSPLGSHRAV
jgi:hypothetical protein